MRENSEWNVPIQIRRVGLRDSNCPIRSRISAAAFVRESQREDRIGGYARSSI